MKKKTGPSQLPRRLIAARRSAAVVLLSLSSLVAGGARADVPSPDQCGPAGSDCENAAPDYKSPGTCTKSQCSKRNYATNETYTYECNVCVASNRPKKDKSRFGCAVSRSPRDGSERPGVMAWALLALGLGRRRATARRREAPSPWCRAQ